jgi:hypothetical protein
MLDAYIIDRIRREQERSQQTDRRLPLQIENPRPVRPDAEERDEKPSDDQRGSVVIDYTL